MTGSGGVSSTPRFLDSITGVSEYWIVRSSRTMTNVSLLATAFARVLQIHRPSKTRGRREDRVRAAPAVSCAKVDRKCAHEHTGSAEAVRPSLRSGFTAYIVLSPARPGLFVTVILKKLPSCELDTSHWGVRTTRLCRTLTPRSSVAALASTAPRPNVSDDGQRPLSRDGMAMNKHLIWVKREANYFCEKGWTQHRVICPSGQINPYFAKLNVIPGTNAERSPVRCAPFSARPEGWCSALRARPSFETELRASSG
jgi:hypothetical protein